MKSILLAVFYIVAGTAYSQTQEKWSSERQDAISDLEPLVKHPNDKSTTILALNILGTLKSNDSVPLAIPLCKNDSTTHQSDQLRKEYHRILRSLVLRKP
jgi:hypothetical protein